MTTLTAEQVQRFHDDGFVVVDRLVDDDTVAVLRAAYDAIVDGLVAARLDGMLGGITRQVLMPSSSHAAFEDNAALRAAAGIAEQLLGESMRTFDMLIYKPPGHPHETPWHQDMAYNELPVTPAGSPIGNTTLQFWVALDDVDPENGCMHFLPRHHTGPLLEHRVASGDPYDPQRLLAFVDPATQVDLSRAVAAPLKAGGATVHTNGTPHYTPPNRSADRPRRAYIFNLASAAALREAGIQRPGTADDFERYMTARKAHTRG